LKKLYLTSVKRILNDAAQKRLDEFEAQDDYNSPKDDYGRDYGWYMEAGIPVPKELEDQSKDYIDFKDEDYDEFEADAIIRQSDFLMAIDDIEYGSTVYLLNGITVSVFEDAETINMQIWYNDLKWYERLKLKIEELINKLKWNKKSKTK